MYTSSSGLQKTLVNSKFANGTVSSEKPNKGLQLHVVEEKRDVNCAANPKESTSSYQQGKEKAPTNKGETRVYPGIDISAILDPEALSLSSSSSLSLQPPTSPSSHSSCKEAVDSVYYEQVGTAVQRSPTCINKPATSTATFNTHTNNREQPQRVLTDVQNQSEGTDDKISTPQKKDGLGLLDNSDAQIEGSDVTRKTGDQNLNDTVQPDSTAMEEKQSNDTPGFFLIDKYGVNGHVKEGLHKSSPIKYSEVKVSTIENSNKCTECTVKFDGESNEGGEVKMQRKNTGEVNQLTALDMEVSERDRSQILLSFEGSSTTPNSPVQLSRASSHQINLSNESVSNKVRKTDKYTDDEGKELQVVPQTDSEEENDLDDISVDLGAKFRETERILPKPLSVGSCLLREVVGVSEAGSSENQASFSTIAINANELPAELSIHNKNKITYDRGEGGMPEINDDLTDYPSKYKTGITSNEIGEEVVMSKAENIMSNCSKHLLVFGNEIPVPKDTCEVVKNGALDISGSNGCLSAESPQIVDTETPSTSDVELFDNTEVEVSSDSEEAIIPSTNVEDKGFPSDGVIVTEVNSTSIMCDKSSLEISQGNSEVSYKKKDDYEGDESTESTKSDVMPVSKGTCSSQKGINDAEEIIETLHPSSFIQETHTNEEICNLNRHIEGSATKDVKEVLGKLVYGKQEQSSTGREEAVSLDTSKLSRCIKLKSRKFPIPFQAVGAPDASCVTQPDCKQTETQPNSGRNGIKEIVQASPYSNSNVSTDNDVQNTDGNTESNTVTVPKASTGKQYDIVEDTEVSYKAFTTESCALTHVETPVDESVHVTNGRKVKKEMLVSAVLSPLSEVDNNKLNTSDFDDSKDNVSDWVPEEATKKKCIKFSGKTYSRATRHQKCKIETGEDSIEYELLKMIAFQQDNEYFSGSEDDASVSSSFKDVNTSDRKGENDVAGVDLFSGCHESGIESCEHVNVCAEKGNNVNNTCGLKNDQHIGEEIRGVDDNTTSTEFGNELIQVYGKRNKGADTSKEATCIRKRDLTEHTDVVINVNADGEYTRNRMKKEDCDKSDNSLKGEEETEQHDKAEEYGSQNSTATNSVSFNTVRVSQENTNALPKFKRYNLRTKH